jgi:hypothetical protein
MSSELILGLYRNLWCCIARADFGQCLNNSYSTYACIWMLYKDIKWRCLYRIWKYTVVYMCHVVERVWELSHCNRLYTLILLDVRVTIDWWPDLFDSLIQRVTTLYSSLLHTHQCPQLLFHCRCLVAASNGGRSPSSGFPKYPLPQLPASNSDSSLTHSLTNFID